MKTNRVRATISVALAMLVLVFVISFLLTSRHACIHDDEVNCRICEAYSELEGQRLHTPPETVTFLGELAVRDALVPFSTDVSARIESPVLLKNKLSN